MPTTVAEALVEALPFVRRWAGATLVVKYGGAAQAQAELSEAVMQDVVLLQRVGVRVVVVHGGGPAVSEMGRRLGLSASFVDGLRVTDDPTMEVAQMVQVGRISREILAGLGRHGGRGVGLSGQDGGGFLRAERHPDPRLGRVGVKATVDVHFLRSLMDAGLVPVIAPVAVDAGMEALNINADTVAEAVAAALGADKLVFMTDVDAIRGPDGPVSRVDASTLRSWIGGAITGGMIPKAEACLSAIAAGVRAVTVLDGRKPHALLLELFTEEGSGTLVVP